MPKEKAISEVSVKIIEQLIRQMKKKTEVLPVFKIFLH